MIVFVADEDTLAGSAHAMLLVMLFKPLETCYDRGVFLWLLLFSAKCVIGERVKA